MVRVGILETGANRPEFVAEHGTFPSWFERLFADTPLRFETFAAYLGELPSVPERCDAYLITGSSASVNDPDNWIGDLSQFIVQAAERRPFIGVCFGHQLLHKIFGGTVETVGRGWGIGVHDYKVCSAHSLIPPGRDNFAFRVSHSEHVSTPAPGTTVLAASDFCPLAMTMIGDNILTVQGHPELSPGFAGAVYEHRRELIGDERVDSAIASLGRPTDDDVFVEMACRFLMSRVGQSSQAAE